MAPKTYNGSNVSVSYLSVTRTDTLVFDGVKYFAQHLNEGPVGSRPVKLSVEPVDYYGNYNWWSVDQLGNINANNQQVPQVLAEGCRLWMATDGYQDMSLVEFLTSLGVLS